MFKRRYGRKSKAKSKRITRRRKSTRKRRGGFMRKPKSLARRAVAGSRTQNDGWVVRLPHKPPTLIPPKRTARLTFTLRFNGLDLTAGSYTAYQFRGNSVYDPYGTGTGHQPRYYDQYDALYNRYYVKACSCEVQFSKRAAGVVMVGLYATPEIGVPCRMPYMGDSAGTFRSTTAPDTGYWDETPNFTHATSSYATTDNQLVLRGRKYTREILDTKTIDPDQLTSNTGGNPFTQWYWMVVFGAPLDPALTDFGDATVTLVYDVVFSAPDIFSLS